MPHNLAPSHVPLKGRAVLALAGLLLAVFAIDVVTPFGYNVWAAYLIPIVIASRRVPRPSFYVFPALSTIFVVADLLLHIPHIGILPSMLVRRTVGVLVIWFVALMLLRYREAEARLVALNRKLNENEARFRLATEAMNGLAYEWEAATGRVEFSPGLAGLIGWRAAEAPATRRWWEEQIHPDDLAAARRRLEEAIARRAARCQNEYRLRHSDGRYLWVLDSSRIVYDNDGAHRRIIGCAISIDDRKRAEEELKENERTVRLLLGSLSEGIWVIDKDGLTTFVNRRMADMLGYTVTEMTGASLFSFMDERDRDAAKRYRERRKRGIAEQIEQEFIRKDGSRIHTLVETSPLIDEDGSFAGAIAGVVDITERTRAETALRESEARFRTVFEECPLGMAIAGLDYRFIRVNARLCEMLGYTAEELTGMSMRDVVPPEDIERDLPRAERLVRGESPLFTMERRYIKKSGELIWASLTASLVRSASGAPLYFIGMAEDISHRKRMEEAMRYQAYHDALTGLPNRSLLMDRLEFELGQAQRHPRRMALLFLDLDRFKYVNDTLGHSAGDELLREVAARLTQCVRETDIIARIGGDEFTVLLTNIAKNEDIAHIAEKIIAAFREPFVVAGHGLTMTTSIGISVFPDDGEYGETLFKNADIAMYHAKELGRNNYQFFSRAISIRTIERMILESSLRQTLDRGELTVYYQPLIDAVTGRVACVEALVRWRHPDLGLIDPLRFIPIAEETGFIATLDEWVLRTACAQLAAWQREGMPEVCLTVNLSARQFHQPQLVGMISRVMEATGLSPAWLGIEITESTAMQDIDMTIANLRKLHRMGIALSLDDFGTGYSSLSSLRSLPIGWVKIDKSFIKGITGSADDLAIVRAIIAMGHHLNLRVVAEGVETEEQLLLLRQEGCDEVQGFYFSEPLPAEEVQHVIMLYT